MSYKRSSVLIKQPRFRLEPPTFCAPTLACLRAGVHFCINISFVELMCSGGSSSSSCSSCAWRADVCCCRWRCWRCWCWWCWWHWRFRRVGASRLCNSRCIHCICCRKQQIGVVRTLTRFVYLRCKIWITQIFADNDPTMPQPKRQYPRSPNTYLCTIISSKDVRTPHGHRNCTVNAHVNTCHTRIQHTAHRAPRTCITHRTRTRRSHCSTIQAFCNAAAIASIDMGL